MAGKSKYLLCLWAFCNLLIGCENADKDIQNLNKKSGSIEIAKEITAVYTTGGKTKAIMKAPLMHRVMDTVNFYEFPQSLEVDFYNDAGNVDSRLTANYGKYTDASSVVYLKDSVRVIGLVKGDTLYCQELYWDRNRKDAEFYTDKPVRIRTRTQTLDGVGLEARQDFKAWHILKPTGLMTVPATEFPQ